MKTMSIERLCDLDRRHGQEVVTFLRHVRRETIDHDDNAVALRQMAERLGVPPAEFSTLVRAKLYAKERGTSCEPTASPVLMATHIGVVLDEFFAWLEVQAEIFENDRDAPADELVASLPVEEHEEDHRRRLGFTPEEWERYLDDLQEDAGMQGD